MNNMTKKRTALLTVRVTEVHKFEVEVPELEIEGLSKKEREEIMEKIAVKKLDRLMNSDTPPAPLGKRRQVNGQPFFAGWKDEEK